jgi:hypothetical protein
MRTAYCPIYSFFEYIVRVYPAPVNGGGRAGAGGGGISTIGKVPRSTLSTDQLPTSVTPPHYDAAGTAYVKVVCEPSSFATYYLSGVANRNSAGGASQLRPSADLNPKFYAPA